MRILKMISWSLSLVMAFLVSPAFGEGNNHSISPEESTAQKTSRPSSDASRVLSPPKSSRALSTSLKNPPVFKCQSALSSEYVKDAEMECRSGERTVKLNYQELKKIENSSKGFVQTACLQQGTNFSGEDADVTKVQKRASEDFQGRFYNGALDACKEKFKKEIGVSPESVTMIKPSVFYYAKKGEEKSSEYKPEEFDLECRQIKNMKTVDSDFQ